MFGSVDVVPLRVPYERKFGLFDGSHVAQSEYMFSATLTERTRVFWLLDAVAEFIVFIVDLFCENMDAPEPNEARASLVSVPSLTGISSKKSRSMRS